MATFATLDALLLPTLGGADSLAILWANPRYDCHLTPIARSEVVSDPARSDLAKALLAGRVATTELNTESAMELAAFAQWSKLVDAGEAEAIAVAVSRGGMVGIEDLFAQRRLTDLHGVISWFNCAGLLLDGIDDGRVSLQEADRIFKTLDCYPGYVKRGFSSLSELRR